ncbi:alanine racemase [Pseudomonas sp. HK3]|jgi:alanine racemase
MARATQAIIDLHALRENYQLAKRSAPNSHAYAVVKANAYGHGVAQVVNALSPTADGFAVACVDEAVTLRELGLLLPILVLEGPMDLQECQTALDLDLELAVHNQAQVAWLSSLSGGAVHIFVKVDSGMHRLGFAVQDVPGVVSQLRSLSVVNSIQLMSHFACADEVGHPFVEQQIRALQSLTAMKLPMSLCNSAAVMTLPQCHHQLIRPGIMLYGSSPIVDKTGPELGLLPVMTLQSEIIALHDIRAGESVGYGQAYVADKDCRIAVVAIGYGDGYPRSAKSGTPVLIRGQHRPIAGRVSMDMITVDVTGMDVSLGETVTLWGTGLSADVVAKHCDTISYELFCQMTQRVKVRYLGS